MTDPIVDPESSRDERTRAQELTLLTGLGLVAVGFLVAQIVGSILYAPLSLIVPGSVLTLIAVTARPETPE